MATLTPQNQWVEDTSPNSVVGADNVTVSPNSGIANLSASRSSDAPMPGGMGTMGNMSLVKNNAPSANTSVYANYSESWHMSTSNVGSVTQGYECDVFNMSGRIPPASDPYNQDAPGLVEAFRTGAGKNNNAGPVSAGYTVCTPGAQDPNAKYFIGFHTGVNSIAQNPSTGQCVSFGLAAGQVMQWFSGPGAGGTFIRYDGKTPAAALNIIATDNGVYLQNAKGQNTHAFTQDANGNGHIQVMQNGSWKTIA